MSNNEARASETSKERIASHQALALDLSRAGCGCDDDATDGCPNWNGERCTFAEYMIAKAIATAEVCAELRGRAEGLRRASSIVDDLRAQHDAYDEDTRHMTAANDYVRAVAAIDAEIAVLRNAAPALIAAAEERDELLRNLSLQIVSQSAELDRLRALLVEAGEAMERRKAFKEEAYSNKDVFDCAVATIDFEFDLLFAEIRRATQTQEPKP